MKSAAHQYEDKLLEFAYGELPQHEAEAVDAHVRGCNRCSQSLSEIRGVRAAMARLPMEPAPDAGLESLLAYAEQAAKRNAAEARPAPSIFKRFLMPLASLAALITVGVVGMRASEEFETSPADAVADQKIASLEEKQKEAAEPAKAIAQTETPPKLDPAALPAEPQPLAAVAPTPTNQPTNKALDKKPEAKNEDSRKDLSLKGAAEGSEELDDNLLAAGKKGGDRGGYEQQAGEVWTPEAAAKSAPKTAPQSQSVRSKAAPNVVGNAEEYRQENFSDVGVRGSKMQLQRDAAKTPPPPPSPPPAQDKPTFGLGTSSPGSGPQGALGGASTGDSSNQAPQAMKPAPVAPPMKAEPAKPEPKDSYAAKREEREKVALAKEMELETRKRAEEERLQERAAVAQPQPAPVAAAPSAPTYSPPSSSYSSKKSKSGGLGITPKLDTRPSAESAYDDEAAVQQSDIVGVNNDAKFDQRKRQQAITQSVENARVASSRGDRSTEIRLLAQALENGASGYERVEALKRICDAYNALGEPERADPFCELLVKEFPNTAAAQSVLAERRKAQRAPAAPKKAAPAERRLSDELDSKPAEAAPAQSY